MPHSKSKQIFFNGHEQYGTLSCSCGKVMEYSNTWELALKTELHMKVCKNPPKEAEVRKPKVKSMTLEEALQYSNDRNKKMIKEAFHQDKSISSKSCSSDLVTETDQKVETYLTNFFKEKFPDHCFIGEESVADGKSCELTDKPTWIVDPIDGTTNFVHRFPFVAVSIGLAINKQVAVASVEEGKLGEVFTKAYQMAFLCKLYGLSLFTIEVGVIYGPILDKLYFAVRGEGAFCGNDRLHVSGQTDLSHALIISEWGSDRGSGILTTKANNMKNVVGRPEGPAHGMRSLGSAAWNMCMVACGSSDIYFECGIHCWDMAAGLVLIQEAGGVLTNTKGGEFDLMARNVICGSSKELVEQVAKLITHIDLPKD